MNCIDFRRLALADPDNRGAEFLEHRIACAPCRRYVESEIRFSGRLREALRVDPPENLAARAIFAAGNQESRSRSRIAMAAGAVAASVGLAWYVAAPQEDLSADLIAHVFHEPNLLIQTASVANEHDLTEVLKRTRTVIHGDVGVVTYAGLCPFRGNLVAHLVVRGEKGPVTLLLLPDEHVDAPVAIDEDGFRGTILPAGRGSIAVIGTEDEVLSPIERKVSLAVKWSI